MNHQQIITHLSVNGDVFKYLFKNLSEEQAHWKPCAERWSLLEVINHLYDEEREDFRKRLALVLSDPDAPWPAIDPEGWVLQRGYNERNLKESLDNDRRTAAGQLACPRSVSHPPGKRPAFCLFEATGSAGIAGIFRLGIGFFLY